MAEGWLPDCGARCSFRDSSWGLEPLERRERRQKSGGLRARVAAGRRSFWASRQLPALACVGVLGPLLAELHTEGHLWAQTRLLPLRPLTPPLHRRRARLALLAPALLLSLCYLLPYFSTPQMVYLERGKHLKDENWLS